jgi:hypothetical protein
MFILSLFEKYQISEYKIEDILNKMLKKEIHIIT